MIDPEITANATDTGRTATHRKKVFTVYRSTHVTKDDSPYILVPVNGRGQSYFLTRNIPKPSRMFAVSWSSHKCLPGWFEEIDNFPTSLG